MHPTPTALLHSLQPGEQAKYGQRFEPMLSSSPQLQHALQRIATVAQIRCPPGGGVGSMCRAGMGASCGSHAAPCGVCLSSCCSRVHPPCHRLAGWRTHLVPSPLPLPLHSLLAPVQPGDRLLCVLNTHLFFHYMAPHIRTMHVWAMVQVGWAGLVGRWAGRLVGRSRLFVEGVSPSPEGRWGAAFERGSRALQCMFPPSLCLACGAPCYSGGACVH